MNSLPKSTLFVAVTLAMLTMFAQPLAAQNTGSSWSQCTDGRAIARCETYDCPRGDTNRDGRCTLTDTDARLTDARNDSFCANPISGCGQVHYYPSGSSAACLERVEESGLNCDLYAVANPTFTPTPTTTATPRPTGTPTTSPTATPIVAKGGDSELPKTGPEHIWLGAVVVLVGAAGIFLYDKYKTV